MSTHRGSLRACCAQALFIARSTQNAMFFIIRHPHAKYYSLCDPEEAELLIQNSEDEDIRLCFCGSAAELLSIIKLEYNQLDMFPHGEQVLALNKETYSGPSLDPAEVNDEKA